MRKTLFLLAFGAIMLAGCQSQEKPLGRTDYPAQVAPAGAVPPGAPPGTPPRTPTGPGGVSVGAPGGGGVPMGAPGSGGVPR